MINRACTPKPFAPGIGSTTTRIERSLREQERELALRGVPGHHFRLNGQESPDRSNALADGSLRRWQRTGELPSDELVRRTVRRDVASARRWKELHARLAEKGLHIEARGRGLVVTDGKETIKVSSVAPELSRRNLEPWFGAMHGERHEPNRRSPRPSVRERPRQANELRTLPPEMLERLLNLPNRLNAAAKMTSRALEETTASMLQETILARIYRSARRMVRATRRLAKHQHTLTETERSLAYTNEKLRRQAHRTQWMQTGVIVLALIAAMLGGITAAFVILDWMR